MSAPAGLDLGLLGWALVFGLAFLGWVRGARSEGITLAGVMASGVVLANDSMRARLTSLANKLPRLFELMVAPEGGAVSLAADRAPLRGPDERLIFSAVAFVLAVAVFYYGGMILGGRGLGRIDRIAGMIMGTATGLVINVTLLQFAQDFLTRHPALPEVRMELPTVLAPSVPSTAVILQYSPLVFVAALGAMACLVVFSLVRR